MKFFLVNFVWSNSFDEFHNYQELKVKKSREKKASKWPFAWQPSPKTRITASWTTVFCSGVLGQRNIDLLKRCFLWRFFKVNVSVSHGGNGINMGIPRRKRGIWSCPFQMGSYIIWSKSQGSNYSGTQISTPPGKSHWKCFILPPPKSPRKTHTLHPQNPLRNVWFLHPTYCLTHPMMWKDPKTCNSHPPFASDVEGTLEQLASNYNLSSLVETRIPETSSNKAWKGNLQGSRVVSCWREEEGNHPLWKKCQPKVRGRMKS